MIYGLLGAIAAILPVGPAIAAPGFAAAGVATGAIAAAYGGGVAAITAAGASVAAFEVGTMSVPKTMLAMVHEGETIIPKPFSEKAKRFLEGDEESGDSSANVAVSYTVNALDAKSVKNMLEEHGHVIGGVVTKLIKDGKISKSLKR
jgi:hypothetical protein